MQSKIVQPKFLLVILLAAAALTTISLIITVPQLANNSLSLDTRRFAMIYEEGATEEQLKELKEIAQDETREARVDDAKREIAKKKSDSTKPPTAAPTAPVKATVAPAQPSQAQPSPAPVIDPGKIPSGSPQSGIQACPGYSQQECFISYTKDGYKPVINFRTCNANGCTTQSILAGDMAKANQTLTRSGSGAILITLPEPTKASLALHDCGSGYWIPSLDKCSNMQTPNIPVPTLPPYNLGSLLGPTAVPTHPGYIPPSPRPYNCGSGTWDGTRCVYPQPTQALPPNYYLGGSYNPTRAPAQPLPTNPPFNQPQFQGGATPRPQTPQPTQASQTQPTLNTNSAFQQALQQYQSGNYSQGIPQMPATYGQYGLTPEQIAAAASQYQSGNYSQGTPITNPPILFPVNHNTPNYYYQWQNNQYYPQALQQYQSGNYSQGIPQMPATYGQYGLTPEQIAAAASQYQSGNYSQGTPITNPPILFPVTSQYLEQNQALINALTTRR